MAVYVYNHPEELWYHNNGKVSIIKLGDKIKSSDVEYFFRVHPERMDCIESDPVVESTIMGGLDITDLKDLVKNQGKQIGELIEVLKKSSSEVRYIIKEGDSCSSPDMINIEEPDFRPNINDIKVDNITAVGSAGDSVTIENGIEDKLSKLAELKKTILL